MRASIYKKKLEDWHENESEDRELAKTQPLPCEVRGEYEQRLAKKKIRLERNDHIVF